MRRGPIGTLYVMIHDSNSGSWIPMTKSGDWRLPGVPVPVEREKYGTIHTFVVVPTSPSIHRHIYTHLRVAHSPT